MAANWAATLGQAGEVVRTSFWVLLIGGVVIGLLVWFINSKKWNKRVTIKQQTGDIPIIRFGKGKHHKEKDGSVWWVVKLKGLPGTFKSLVPPKESLSVLANGMTYAEGELTTAGDIIWTTSQKGISRALTPEEKSVLAEEFQNSEEWSAQNKTGFAKFLEVVNLMFPFLVIALLIFGAGEYMAPAIQLNDQYLRHQTNEIELTNAIKELKQDIREIKSDMNYMRGQDNGNLPTEAPQ